MIILWLYYDYIIVIILWLYYNYITIIFWLYYDYIMIILWLYYDYIMIILWLYIYTEIWFDGNTVWISRENIGMSSGMDIV